MPAASEVGVGHAQLDADPSAHHALSLTVLAGYYWNEEVEQRLGYPGQHAALVSPGFPRT